MSGPSYTFRPIGTDWPDPHSTDRRYSQFTATYGQTITLLEAEIEKLGGENVVIQIDLRDQDIRLDGRPRSNAPQPEFPGVMVSFESRHGPLRYYTDAFPSWKENLRAIALGLEKLRAVDRYGITKRGEQYTGWKALPETAGHHEPGLIERGQILIEEHGGVVEAIKATHPDRPEGNADKFRAVQAARDAGVAA